MNLSLKPYAPPVSPQTVKPQKRKEFYTRVSTGVNEVKHHSLNIGLMGASTLLFPLLPKPFHMSLKHSLTMAPVHMIMMALITFGVNVTHYKTKKSPNRKEGEHD